MKISKEKIELISVRQGLSTKELSERCGISRQNLSTIKNRGTCNTATAFKICRALKCDVSEITD